MSRCPEKKKKEKELPLVREKKGQPVSFTMSLRGGGGERDFQGVEKGKKKSGISL